MRVYEYAKKHNHATKEIIQVLKAAGFAVESHMVQLTDPMLEYLNSHNVSPTTKIAEPVIEKKVPSREKTEQKKSPHSPKPESALSTKSEEGISIEPMTVSDFSQKIHKPVTDVIVSLLKQGIAAAKNQVINEKVVEQLAKTFNIPIRETKAGVAQKDLPTKFLATGNVVERLPIIVVVGHVDHGKTTLLDYIRKSRVAEREKGGITQHLGAYEVTTSQGDVVFLDTPGHEAFIKMRERGTRVADIAILVVAADDGIMPQTAEAIRQSQAAGIPIIVAINKIDKVQPYQIESVKKALGAYGLIPEEWGGQTICAAISAKDGTGVDELLDVVVLQSKMMELVASIDAPAKGYVLEAKMEKGLGPIATVILQQGTLKVGDHFLAGKTTGKVVSLKNTKGKRINEITPSHPVQVAGFDELAQAGDVFEVATASEAKKHRSTYSAPPTKKIGTESGYGIILKVDNDSTREAVVEGIRKVNKKAYQPIQIVHAGIGNISESDVELAHDTGASLYTLHSKIEPSAYTLAIKYGVRIKQFDIIYRLIEDLEVVSQEGRPVKMIQKKVGEGVVLKVFDIKNVGIIVGFQVINGKFVRQGKVSVWRGRTKVGEGSITSLQREKKTIKEASVGLECAIAVDGFDAWQVDDRIECYQEVPE